MPKDNSTTVKPRRTWIILVILTSIIVLPTLIIFIKFSPFIKSFLNPPKHRVNVLLLGKGGAGHEAPDLTDTIIFASLTDEKINLVSLPRDIWVAEIRAKLNSAYYWGKQKQEGFGIVDDSVTKILGQPVNYNLVVDFSIFKNVVDAIGGIEVNVQNSFVDEKYPIEGKENDPCDGDRLYKCRYETVTFEKGMQKMDGQEALKFVRSRNAEGDEGTDLAREARQQLVIGAIQRRIFSPQVYLNPRKLSHLWKNVLSSIETDISLKDAGGIVGKIFVSNEKVMSLVIPENMFENPPISPRYDNQYVFIPKSGDWDQIQKWLLERI